MNIQSHLDRLRNDEGLTDGIGDEEAKALIDAIIPQVEAALGIVQADASLADASKEAKAAEATKRFAGKMRTISKIVASLCYDEDKSLAEKLWKEMVGDERPLPKSTTSPVAVLKTLMAEGVGRA